MDESNEPKTPTTGEPVENAVETSPTSGLPPEMAPQAPFATEVHHPTKKTPVIIVAIILLIAAIAGTAFFLKKAKPQENTPTATVQKKDILNIRYMSGEVGYETFYPATDVSVSYQEANYMLFEGLVRYENKTQIVPLLATGWTNPDDSTWVFTLKKGVKFHTGREMTATDVKASFEAAKNSDSGELYASTIESITVDSPYQVTIKTDAPDATLLKKLVSYFVYDTTSGKAADPINGTGAFVVKPGTTPTADSLELVAFDQYHGGHVYVRSFSFISDKDVKQAKGTPYAEKRADIISFSARAAEIPNTRTYNKEEVEALGVFHLPLNHLRKGPLQNLKVRQALVLAVDPDAVSKVRGQQGERASQLVPRSVPGFDSTVETPKRDVAKAKALLTEAGYPNGISIMLTYYAPSKSTAEELAKEFKEAGITLVLDPQTEIKNLGAKAQGGKTDMYFLTSATDILDASDVLSQYADSANYKNQEVIDLLGLAQKTLDPAKRLGYLKQASHKMAVDVATVPVFSPISTSIIYDPSYVIQRDIANGSNGIYFWKVYAK